MFGSVAYPRKAMLASAAGIYCLLAASFACSVPVKAAGNTPVPSTTWLQLADARKGAADRLFLTAIKLYRAGDLEGAAENFEMGLSIDPENPVAHFYFAETLSDMKRDKAALAHYRKASELAPGSEEGIIANLKLKKLAQKFAPGKVFKDCDSCPEMVVIPAGSFIMGSREQERIWAAKSAWPDAKYSSERASHKRMYDGMESPNRRVTLRYAFAIGRYEVTVGQWKACVAAAKCKELPKDFDYRGKPAQRPDDVAVHKVSWNGVKSYLQWLSLKTGLRYRLPSESEWEYMARAGTTTAFNFGQNIDVSQAHFSDVYGGISHYAPISVGRYQANAFGVYDVHGNVAEITEDCQGAYGSVPSDGSAHTPSGSYSNCHARMTRGGSFSDGRHAVRSAARGVTMVLGLDGKDFHAIGLGFRVTRDLD